MAAGADLPAAEQAAGASEHESLTGQAAQQNAEPEGSADSAAPDETDAPLMEEVSHERLEVAQVIAILEAALQAAEHPLTVDQCQKLFRRGELPVSHSETQRELVKRLLEEMIESFEGRGVELKRVASGYRLQVRQEYSRWVSRLWEEKPPRYSRALLETLSLIAYRQPVTRGDIEQVRGVAVSQNIVRTLSERGWIREVGHREVPGRPALYGTTKAFLDYFNLKSLAQLPPLEEIRELIEPVVIEELAGADAPGTSDTGAVEATDSDAEVAEATADATVEAESEAQARRDTEGTVPDAGAADAEAGIEVTFAGDADAETASTATAGFAEQAEPADQQEQEAPAEQAHTADVVPLPRNR